MRPPTAILHSDCQRCCEADKDGDKPQRIYPYAELVVCAWKLGRYPQVQAFVKSDRPKQFPGLTVRYVRGADPAIRLLNEEHDVVETLGIEKWNTDSVEAFFQERLHH